MEDIDKIVKWMKESKYTVVFTGAGMSTESGIPDFRSKSGWWNQVDPRTVATTEALNDNYSQFYEFYQKRVMDLKKYKPHKGHEILAKWEENGLIHSISTQNVDGFHQKAGNQQVYELHGTINSIRCNQCKATEELEYFLKFNSCKACGGKLRPNVVLFGEMLPQEAWNNALTDIRKSELVLVIGTSLQVYPVNQLPTLSDGKVVYINDEILQDESDFDLTIKGKAKEVLESIDERI